MSGLIKIRPVGAELFYADRRTEGQTDMTKLIVAFRNFANAPKNQFTAIASLCELIFYVVDINAVAVS